MNLERVHLAPGWLAEEGRRASEQFAARLKREWRIFTAEEVCPNTDQVDNRRNQTMKRITVPAAVLAMLCGSAIAQVAPEGSAPPQRPAPPTMNQIADAVEASITRAVAQLHGLLVELSNQNEALRQQGAQVSQQLAAVTKERDEKAKQIKGLEDAAKAATPAAPETKN